MNLAEMNGEQLLDRKAELLAEMTDISQRESRSAEDVENLEARRAEVEALDAEIEARKAAAAEEARKAEEAAKLDGKPIFEEEKRMNYSVESPEYRSGLLKDLLGKELTEEERTAISYVATTGDTTHGAAYVLPREMLNQIWDLIDDQHSILGDITLYRTGTILEIAKRIEIEQGDAASVNENAANDDEVNKFAKVTLSGKDFSKHVDISYAMAQMSIEAFESFLVNEIADRMGAALAADVVTEITTNYDSTNNAVEGAEEDVIGWADVAGALATLKNAKGECVVYGRQATIYKYLVGMVDTTGRPIYQPNAQAGAQGTLVGFPVKVEDAVPADTLLIGYPKQVVGNMIQDIMVESDRNIKKHVITYAGYARFECELMAAKAFATLIPGQGS